MPIFNNEAEMQAWLSEELDVNDGLADLIINHEHVSQMTARLPAENKILKSFQWCLKSLYINEVFLENENISLKAGDILKPDFVLYAPENQCIVIIELKNIIEPTRQAGTELSAYASEIKSYLPFISDSDIVNVIISPNWPTLLRHYVFNEIFWLNKNILCLEPVRDDDKIKLKIIEAQSITEDDAFLKFSEEHFGGYHLCLYNYTGRMLDDYIEQMKSSLSFMATKGNILKSHGFAFLWKNHEQLPAAYIITIVNLAPLQAIERFFHNNQRISHVTEKFINIINEYAPEGQSQSLFEITDTGIEFLNNFCSPRPEDFTTWDILKTSIFQRGHDHLIAFKCWGFLEDMFSEILLEEYNAANLFIELTNPHLGLKLLDELFDPCYEFINLPHIMFNEDEEEITNDNYMGDNPFA